MEDLLSVFEQDERYFKEHPGLSEYVREAVPGEFGGHAKMGEGLPKVLVVQLDDRMRIRIPHTKKPSDGPTVVVDVRGVDQKELSELMSRPSSRTPAAVTAYGAHLLYANGPR